jgi:nicotinamide-nucleotide amidase
LYAEDDIPIETAVVQLLMKQYRTLSLAESCTGGMVAEMVTTVPGSADAFMGGVVSYTNAVKMALLGVPAVLLQGEGAPGAVSEETAAAMAEGVRQVTDSDFGVSVTGVAGPAAAEGKPVGLVYLGLAERDRPTRTEKLQLSGDREGIRLRASKRALYRLWLVLTGRE